MMIISSLLFLSALYFPSIAGYNNGLALTPQMGWNSWNKFGCDINETKIIGIAEAMISSGLARAGYEFVNIDDCWGDDRDAHGRQQFEHDAWPMGPFKLTSYIHSLGLKAGIYSDAGSETCAGRPGSLGFEVIDALTFCLGLRLSQVRQLQQ